jgi:hypothetical protein
VDAAYFCTPTSGRPTLGVLPRWALLPSAFAVQHVEKLAGTVLIDAAHRRYRT